MRLIFELSKQDKLLSIEEVLALSGRRSFTFHHNILLVRTRMRPKFLAKRLAFTKKISKCLFVCHKSQLLKKFKSFNWQRYYKNSYCVRIYRPDRHPLTKLSRDKFTEKELGSLVWHRLKRPRVDVETPVTQIEVYIIRDRAICGLLLEEIDQGSFEKRRDHLRPASYPVSLHPRLARCLINLTGARKGRITDPFCGTGGILIEAGLMGLIPIGYDLDDIMLKICRKNLGHYKIKNYKLMKKDSTRHKSKTNYCATDLPYNLNRKEGDLEKLYIKFLKNLKKNLKKKAVIIMPDFIDHRKIVKKAKFRIEKQFKYYVHKSLSRRILILK